MFYVYILQSRKDQKYYIGQTNNLAKRLTYYNCGKVSATKNIRPFQVVYSERYNTRSEAMCREKKIKLMKGGNNFKKLLL